LLQTSDGYVYAIPMFRIPRRNSGGYSVENVNGADDYASIMTKNSGTYTVNQDYIDVEEPSKYLIGDQVAYSLDSRAVPFITKIEGNRLWLSYALSSVKNFDIGETDIIVVSSRRPDNLYSNIIDQRDIIDLRHKVSLTGEDYNKIMNEEFNRLLAGENGNVEMKKEYFGLEKAPNYVEVQQDNYPYVVENLIPSFYEWDLHEDATAISPYELELNPSGDYQGSSVKIEVIANQDYTFNIPNIENEFYYDILFLDEEENKIGEIYNARERKSFITPNNTKIIKIYTSNGIGRGIFTFKNPILSTGSQPNPVFVPYGKWYVPADYANQDTNVRFDLTDQKRILSDAQTSQKVSDKIEVLSNDHLKHIEVTQAIQGIWSAGDTIKIKGYDGIVSGVIDEDTALAKLLETPSNTTIIVDDVSKLTVGDKIKAYTFGWSTPSADVSIVSIDSNTNTVTISSSLIGWLSSSDRTYIIETTADTSDPIVKAEGINGEWTNKATSEATYTIDTVPTDNTADILIEYSVNYAGGQGIEHVPNNVLEAEVNGQKLVKNDDGIITIKANFEGKESGNTDLNPHIIKYEHEKTTLRTPYETGKFEPPQFYYDMVDKLDNILFSIGSNVLLNGNIAQQLFSFNIIRAIQDKLGEGFFEGCMTIEDKVQRVSQSDIYWTYRWYGFGENPNGNKAVI
ncbi:hypothetical protein Q5Y73_24470, partial [Chengkuizengella sp. 2205SS18-9]|nr:hypothetical protein [Chengkuizengella sp. 2205SS18-9]